MERTIQAFAALHLVVIGVSHLVRPRDWVDFFVWLRSKGHAGVIANGMLSLWFGSVIVVGHNVWHGPAIVLTLFGWAQVVKGTLSLVAPQFGLRGMRRVSPERSREFVFAGGVALALGLLFAYLAYTG